MQPQIDAPLEAGLQQRALRQVRSLVERNRQQGREIGSRAPRCAAGSLGIVGAGLMGTAIAAAHVRRNLPVVITDADAAVLDKARERIAGELAAELPDDEARWLVDGLVQPSGDLAAVARCDLVLESIVESVVAKQQLYARLEPLLPEGTILATNTSTIPIARLGERLRDPERFCGFHFCHPVRQRALVEIVRGPKSGEPTIAAVAAHARAIEKMPIVVEDGPGFVVNRLLLPYLGEALEMLLEGADIEQIERAATEFGMAKGPLGLLDEIGLDTVLQGGSVLAAAFPEQTTASPLLVALVKAGRRGCKSGTGVFSYAHGPAEAAFPHVDPVVRQIIAQWARPGQDHSRPSVTARLFLPMVLEATRILEDRKVQGPHEIDLAAIFALGFPASRGGLLWWADTLGAAQIVELLRGLDRLGPGVQPTQTLLAMARDGGRFHAA